MARQRRAQTAWQTEQRQPLRRRPAEVTVLVWSDKLKNNCRYEVCGLLLRDAAHSEIKWERFMFGPRYGGKGYKEGPPREQKSWIDGLVVSRRYVGPAKQ